MRPTWFFILHDGLEPGETFGPVTSAAGEVRAIVEAMGQHPDLADPEGSACLYRLEVDDHGTPHVDAYSRRFMNRCRRTLDAGRQREGAGQ
jgi:hypothetical protein